MILRIVSMRFEPSKLSEFELLFRRHHSSIEAQEGCHKVQLLLDAEDPCMRGTMSVWDSEAHLNAYRRTELFGKVWPSTKALFIEPPKVWTYRMDARK